MSNLFNGPINYEYSQDVPKHNTISVVPAPGTHDYGKAACTILCP